MSKDLFKPTKDFKEIDLKKSAGILEDFDIKKNIATREGTVEKVPVNNSDIANKAYVDSVAPANLTNDGMADALHRHSELSASDGTPNPAVYVDAAGNVGIGTTSPSAKLEVNRNGVAGNGITALSGELNAHTSITIGRKAIEGRMGVVSGEGEFFGDSEAGGIAIRNDNITKKIFLGAGALSSTLTITNTSVGIGTTTPTNGVFEIVGQVYGSADCSMLSFTDRTPYPENLQVAYDAIDSVEGTADGKINKEKLNPILKSGEDGRNLSMTVSVLLEVVKDIKKRIEIIENK